nr:hypothetical protein BV025_00241 [Haemophilus influenzae]
MTFNLGSNPVKFGDPDISRSIVPPLTLLIIVCALPKVLSGNNFNLISPFVFFIKRSLNFLAALCWLSERGAS